MDPKKIDGGENYSGNLSHTIITIVSSFVLYVQQSLSNFDKNRLNLGYFHFLENGGLNFFLINDKITKFGNV